MGEMQMGKMGLLQADGKRWRLWVAAIILAGMVGSLVWVWGLGDDEDRQAQVLTTHSIAIVGSGLMLAWFLFLSGFRAKTRIIGIGSLVACAFLFVSLFRYGGVSGDLVPIFVPRWRSVDALITGEDLDPRAPSQDYAQFLGPDRSATISGVGLARDWDDRPPRLIWRRPVGVAWSAFAVAGELAVTQEQHDDEERVVAYELATGNPRWTHVDRTGYRSELAGDGPRATPTISGGRVFCVGATGRLNAIELATGKSLWSRDVLDDGKAEVPAWGYAVSPLVVDGKVILCRGGSKGASVVAYAEATGDVLWEAGDGDAGYASPFLATLGGLRQVVAYKAAEVAGYDPVGGRQLWSHPWPARQPNASQPLVVGPNRLLVSTGYGYGSQLLEFSPGEDGTQKVDLVWRSRRMKSKFANMIAIDGKVYGLDDGGFTCVDLSSGKRIWKSGRYGHGQLVRVDDLILVLTETGDIVLIDPDPEGLRELTRYSVIDGKVWNPPALAGSRLLVRNHREAALFELPTVN